MKNVGIGAFLAVIILVVLANVVRAQIVFPDSTLQTTAFKCVTAGTGAWSVPQALGTALDDGVNENSWLDSVIDCSGTLHWVRTHSFGTGQNWSRELLYSNSDNSELVTIADGSGLSGVGEANRLISSPSISIDSNGNIFVMYLLNGPSSLTPYFVENLTP